MFIMLDLLDQVKHRNTISGKSKMCLCIIFFKRLDLEFALLCNTAIWHVMISVETVFMQLSCCVTAIKIYHLLWKIACQHLDYWHILYVNQILTLPCLFLCQLYAIFTQGLYGHRVLSLPASVCPSVCQSLACPRDNSRPIEARITKFEP